MRRNEGSSSLQVMAVLLLLTAITGAAALFILNARSLGRPSLVDPLDEELLATLAELLPLFTPDDPAQPDSLRDPAYGFAKDGYQITVRELSSQINPNWVYLRLLSETPLSALFLSADAAERLVQSRLDDGIATDIATRYADFFTETAFEKYLSAYSYPNIDNADAYAIERLVLDCTGDGGAANVIRQEMEQKRTAGSPFSDEELEALLSAQAPDLAGIIGAQPNFNVNCVDPFVLRCLLAYPPLEIPNPAAKAAALLVVRQTGALTVAQISTISGLEPDHNLFNWLGDKSWFWQVEIRNDSRYLQAILGRSLPRSGQLEPEAGTGSRVFLISWQTGAIDAGS
ncbi:MAG: hypothetical protein A2087_08065 [Spirochaetes bacterium GWD1_61_31]|nr:MAG: hypothetical protein A2087_08065 [Spirochaetes bacterium GWD1_61_31]OHD43941.1 MAG: hypothetical protein A2Y35_08720 [Spirochaetes bacterium GWE1_60_18]HAP42658.1 hypothetical protein [Spirochaetaceae bacterium]HAW85481.1 hypothetical protein [Spirochaetaceae bacterium]HAX37571.1 hypothetical protein [Spirochaetaceae bacterium]